MTSRKYYLAHRDEILAKNKRYREKNKEKLSLKSKERHLLSKDRDLERSKKHFEKNKDAYRDRARANYQANKKRHAEQGKEWVARNPEKRRKAARRYNRKIRNTLKGNLSSTISKRMNESLRRGMKAGRHWETLVNFTVDQLKRHIEKQFKPGMTWENYGTHWHIDHKIPIAIFNFEKPEDVEFRLCWSLKNLQPLEAGKNMSKGAKLEKPYQPPLPLVGGLR